MVKYELAFKKPFTDFTKLIIGIVLSIIPIVNLVAKGFAIESSGLGKTKPSNKMPEWKNFGHLFIRGLLAFIIAIIYMIPGILVISVAASLTLTSVIGIFAGRLINPDLMTYMGMKEFSPGLLASMISQNLPLILPTLIVTVPLFLVGLALLILASYMVPMAVLNYVKKNKFGAAFDLTTVLKKVFTGKYFVAWLITMIVTTVLVTILSFIPIVGTAAGIFISAVIYYSIFGQVFKEV